MLNRSGHKSKPDSCLAQVYPQAYCRQEPDVEARMEGGGVRAMAVPPGLKSDLMAPRTSQLLVRFLLALSQERNERERVVRLPWVA